MKMYAGILFADLRGFTARFEDVDPEEASKVLRRFYRCAEDVLFPDAVIDKLIGDEVMALYLPLLKRRTMGAGDVPGLMLKHGRELLKAVGYGSRDGPFVELGIGLDVGETFVGNIGHRAVYDFTAIGDAVNTASRLEAEALGGEIVFSDRVASGLSTSAGTRVELQLKGKSRPQTAYRATSEPNASSAATTTGVPEDLAWPCGSGPVAASERAASRSESLSKADVRADRRRRRNAPQRRPQHFP
jgi:adenylate cyclase